MEKGKKWKHLRITNINFQSIKKKQDLVNNLTESYQPDIVIGIETRLNLTERFQLDIVIGIETWLNLTERFQLDIVIGIETWLNLTERF